ncbi:MAG: sialidase family protein [Flavobacteriales bacterium]|nr:sialidase family protein [Flavobacteriales bacterium]
MKKTTTLIASFFFAVILSAQIVPGQNHKGSIKAIDDQKIMKGDENLSHLMLHPNPHTHAVMNSKSSSFPSEVIGYTTYDLQSNGSVQNRLDVHDDGTISAGWTMSKEFNTTYSDRGTGYNYFDGTSWINQIVQPTDQVDRIETSRVGWASVFGLGNGEERVITHSTSLNVLNQASRTSIGTGAWTDANIGEFYMIWNRSVAGGLDGNTIHMIALTEPMGTGWSGSLYNGLNGALLYFRSQDGGAIWDIDTMQLPTMDTAHFLGFSADDYAISAKGETVVVAYFNDWGDSFIVKSTDNGDSWTNTTFLNFPHDKYAIDEGLDLDSDGVLDQVYSTDNSGALIIDDQGMAHVFYGIMMYADDDLSDGSSSWFPLTNGIAYWNESYGADNTPPTVHAGDTSLWYSDMMNDHWIAEAPDLNGDPNVGGVDEVGGYALYYRSQASMPSAGLSSNGEIYMTFSGYTETVDNGSQVFRHIYVTKSTDGGTTWKTPVDITPHDDWDGMQECVYGSLSPVVDDKLRLIYQLDFEPGLAVQGDEDLVDWNAIHYLEVDTVGLFDNTTPPVSILEAEDFNNRNGRVFDILGREWKTNFADLPKGMYIIDGKKVFKNK